MLGELIGFNWNCFGFIYCIYFDRFFICCCDWFRIWDWMGIRGDNIFFVYWMRFFIFFDLIKVFERNSRSWYFFFVYFFNFFFFMGGWGLFYMIWGRCLFWMWNFNFWFIKGYFLIGYLEFFECVLGVLLILLLYCCLIVGFGFEWIGFCGEEWWD